MASVATERNGRRRILFVAPDGGRKTVRLGRCDERSAQQVCRHVEALLAARIHAQPVNRETAVWLSNVCDKLHDRLARAGLVEPRAGVGAVRLGPAIRAYIGGRVDLKPASRVVMGQVIRDLVDHFGEGRDVRTITAGDADEFKQSLVARGLAATTIHKRLGMARSFFHALRRRRLIEENPLADVRMTAAGIRDRQRFITREETAALLQACPNYDWRCIVALSRYGGLRCPSEVLSLRWQDIDWERGRITVTSPKTERFAGKATRTIPLFPELREVLIDAFELAPEGAEYVVDERLRRSANGPEGWKSTNLRTTFRKIVRRAGLEPWPRLFHNLRASRETELAEAYPVHVVTSWIGNTPTVAMRHYLMTTDEHFERAIRGDGTAGQVAQNPAQQMHASKRKTAQGENRETRNLAFYAEKQQGALLCASPQTGRTERGGFEPPVRV